jgi:hypothetical protein
LPHSPVMHRPTVVVHNLLADIPGSIAPPFTGDVISAGCAGCRAAGSRRRPRGFLPSSCLAGRARICWLVSMKPSLRSTKETSGPVEPPGYPARQRGCRPPRNPETRPITGSADLAS